MKLTQEIIDQIQEAMLHTNLKGEINWKDGDDIQCDKDIGCTFDYIKHIRWHFEIEE